MLGTEANLILAIALNSVVLCGAYLFSRRRSADGLNRLIDTLLLWLAVQYSAVMIPGLLHILNPISMAIAGLSCAFALGWFGLRGSNDTEQLAPGDRLTTADRAVIISGTLFVCGALGGWAYLWASTPLTATDALTYHFPAAVQWLRDGRISLLPTWFFNPANTYSPLAGSAFIAWWIGPMHNDVLARFVQIPPLLLIYAALVQIGRAVGARAGVAVVIALAAVMSRPLLGEAVLGKDDLYQAAFFTAAVAACVPNRLRATGGATRLGIAIGLMLATKFTALLSLPILLLTIDAPFIAGWRWKRWATAIGVAIALSAPWYLRNIWLTGNPVFPIDVTLLGHRIFTGLLTTSRANELRTATGLWKVLTEGYFAVPVVLTIMLAVSWLVAFVMMHIRLRQEPSPSPGTPGEGRGEGSAQGRTSRKTASSAANPHPNPLPEYRERGQKPIPLLRHPLSVQRVCLMGPIVGILLFTFTAPYAEVRFLIPSLLLLFAAAAGGLQLLANVIRHRLARQIVAGTVALAVLAVSLYTTHNTKYFVVDAITGGLVTTAVGWFFILGFHQLNRFESRRRIEIMGLVGGCAILALAGLIYVEWNSYVVGYKLSVDPAQADEQSFWKQAYAEGESWSFIRRELPGNATIAYANTYLVYPLLGFDLTRRAVYVSPRRDIERIDQLPRPAAPLSGHEIENIFAAVMNTQADQSIWLQRLRQSGAQFLYIVKPAGGIRAPELDFAAKNPARFTLLYDDPHTVVYRIAP